MSCHDRALQGFETALAQGGAITNASTGPKVRMATRRRRSRRIWVTLTAADILALPLFLVSLLSETAVRALVGCRFALGHLKVVVT